MRITKYIACLVLGAIFFTSCEVDYIENPNEPGVPPTSGLMSRVQKQLMNDTRDEWFSGRMALLWVQYWNQVNYTEEDRFLYRETVNKSGWDDLYANARDLKSIIDINTDPELKIDAALDAPNENQIAAARIMLAYIFQLATDIWGDIPYYSYGTNNQDFDALYGDEGVLTPQYARQKDIYVDLLKELDEAQAMIIEDANMINGDNIYNGDATKWKKFANSLRLRIANRIKDVEPDLAAEHIADALAQGVFESNEDNAVIYFENSALNGAPMYRAFYVENRTDFSPSYSFVELLKGNRGPFGMEDPRLPIYVAPNGDGFYYGVPMANSNDKVREYKHESLPGDVVLSPTYGEVYMEYSEVCFILSELNGWDQTLYEEGVRASMSKWDVESLDIEDYVNALPPASEETVMTQKYIALYMQPYEAWSEIRRTGYPTTLIKPGETYTVTTEYYNDEEVLDVMEQTFTFEPIVDLDVDVPTRVKYLLNEASVNSVNLEDAIVNMGGDEMDTPLWWME
ncbi:SusD/RagB family nutrient-binding outer membrane lipoprotein [Thermophagus sp. OGC60D27]|uniref:SusD/RagB family nutrient-binding outer membrane lipoprotein n=1 Tax=Thermophagus sp. OGC60D27 TaxID=3458415 RepID=UPI0040377FC2